MRYIWYTTDKRTKTEIGVLAIAHQVPVEELVRNALTAHLNDIESDFRTEGCTVGLNPDMLNLLEESCDRTGLSQSKAIYLCIKKYLEDNKALLLQLAKTS